MNGVFQLYFVDDIFVLILHYANIHLLKISITVFSIAGQFDI